jgi:hypothetical protein
MLADLIYVLLGGKLLVEANQATGQRLPLKKTMLQPTETKSFCPWGLGRYRPSV